MAYSMDTASSPAVALARKLASTIDALERVCGGGIPTDEQRRLLIELDDALQDALETLPPYNVERLPFGT